MKNILFLADYFPELSSTSIRNHFIAEELHSKGFNMFLASESWCYINDNHELGTFDECRDNKIFVRKYYLDPLQIDVMDCQDSKCVKMLGLCCRILETEHVDAILVSEIKRYGYIAEILKYRYPEIPIMLSVFSSDTMIAENESYEKFCSRPMLKSFDVIFSLPLAGYNIGNMNIAYKEAIPFSAHEHEALEQNERNSFFGDIFAEKYIGPYIKILQSFDANGRIYAIGKYAEKFVTQAGRMNSMPDSVNEFFNILRNTGSLVLLNTFCNVYMPDITLTTWLMGIYPIISGPFAKLLTSCGNVEAIACSNRNACMVVRYNIAENIKTVSECVFEFLERNVK